MEKEKTDKLVNFAMRQTMFDKFKNICDNDFKTISEGLRELITKRIREEEKVQKV